MRFPSQERSQGGEGAETGDRGPARAQRLSRALAALSALSLLVGGVAHFLSDAVPEAVLLTALGAVTTLVAVLGHGLVVGPLALVIAVSAWGSASGAIPQVPPWDRIEHATGGLLLVLFLVDHAERMGVGRTRPLRQAGFAWLATATMALLWEGLESGSDHLFATEFSLGPRDSVGDLVAGLSGATVAALLAAYRFRSHRVEPAG